MRVPKSFLILVFTLATFACNPPTPAKIETFTLDSVSQALCEQTLLPDATAASSITFDAPSQWSTSVVQTRSVTWLTVSPDHGNAGIQTVSFTLLPNDTPEPRSAQVTFSCEGGSFDVTITQEGMDPPEASDGKHPVVAVSDRMSHALMLDEAGQMKEAFLFEYGTDGKLSRVKEYHQVKDGFYAPEDLEEVSFARAEGSIQAIMSSRHKSGLSYKVDPDGTVPINGGSHASPDRITNLYFEKYPFYADEIMDVTCTFAGKEMTAEAVSEEEHLSLRFVYDEEGNLLVAEDAEGTGLKGEWTDGNLTTIRESYLSYHYSVNGVSMVEEKKENVLSVTYSDRENPFRGVSINAFLFEDLMGLEVFLDDEIAGLQTRTLPTKMVCADYYSTSSLDIGYSYTFDEAGRVASVTVRETRGSDVETVRYNFYYDAASAPLFSVYEDPSETLVSQQMVQFVYDENYYANAFILRSTFADGRVVEDRLYPVRNYCPALSDPILMYPSDPSLDRNVTHVLSGVTRAQYDALGKVRISSSVKHISGEGSPYSEMELQFAFDFGETKLYSYLYCESYSEFDYIAWWDGSQICYVDCTPYIMDIADIRLIPAGDWSLNSVVRNDAGKMTQAILSQPVSPVWPNNQYVHSGKRTLQAAIYLDFVEGGI